MSHHEILFRAVEFAYDTSPAPLFEKLDLHLPAGWTGIVGANGAGKTTLLRLAIGELIPRQGRVQAPPSALYCAQRTDEPPPLLAQFLAEAEACQLRGRLGVGEDWLERWDSLSHGERKRAQLGVALWRGPQVLAVDEPTNHLDLQAKALLSGALRTFQGVGLLVSHDRQLLDELCRQCVFIDPPAAHLRPGTFTEGMAQARLEEARAHRQRELAREERQRLEQESRRRREEAARSQARRSKRGLDPKDHDARFKRNRARISGKDGSAGKLLRQLDGRLEQARERLESAQVKKTYDLGIWMPGARSHRRALFTLPAGVLPLGEGRCLCFPDLAMAPDQRVALTGPNGGGKSTLVRRIVQSLSLPEAQVVYLPQELPLSAARQVLDRVRALPRDQLGKLMSVVSCLGSRPQRLLDTAAPSPGEARKLLLALGIVQTPHLIVMDEPTNHLDLPSIQCLEDALAGCPCGLLLVSHDLPFLARLARTRWQLEEHERGEWRLQVGEMRTFSTGPAPSDRSGKSLSS
ncbi:MAG: ABC-F family ATP-binding cassette domain-containing protein [Candidatus Latescibacteria bacterium]|nr:ABC-F family ATP-binding cassette domain-containing protein [Candidatus Latescibacterota bacterium]